MAARLTPQVVARYILQLNAQGGDAATVHANVQVCQDMLRELGLFDWGPDWSVPDEPTWRSLVLWALTSQQDRLVKLGWEPIVAWATVCFAEQLLREGPPAASLEAWLDRLWTEVRKHPDAKRFRGRGVVTLALNTASRRSYRCRLGELLGVPGAVGFGQHSACWPRTRQSLRAGDEVLRAVYLRLEELADLAQHELEA